MSSQVMERTPARKRRLVKQVSQEPEVDAKKQKVTQPERLAEYELHGVPSVCQARLNALLSQWGNARWKQILGLWTFLGDGTTQRPVATSALQVWGPPGTGKTVIVADFLKRLQIRHVWLNCACFTSIGELHARLAELLRRIAATVAPEVRELQHRAPVGRQLRSLDRLEAALKLPLESISCLDGVGEIYQQVLPKGIQPVKLTDSKGPVKVVIVLDQAQELSRLSPGGLELLTSLPEVLQRGNQISVVTISRLPLSSIGLPVARDPPAVAFRGYTEEEAERALAQSLSGANETVAASTCAGAVLKFASPQLGYDLRHLKGVGLEVVRRMPDVKGLAAVQQIIEEAVERRVGLCDLRGFPLPAGCDVTDPVQVATLATMHQMTKAEMRLVVASYLAAHIPKEDDCQLFYVVQRKARRQKSVLKKPAEDTHITAQAPKAALLTRVLAIYHHLAQQPQLIGPPLFEKLASLREAGLIRFMGDRAGVEHDPKVICRAELPLVRECCCELNIDLAAYLMGAQ